MADNSDDNYCELLNLMRNMGSKDNPTTLYIGTMKSATSVEIDGLVLTADDLYIAEHLITGYEFPLKTSYVSAVSFSAQTTTKQSTAVLSKGLQKGDLVAVMKLNDKDTYVILERVCRP